MYNTTYFVLFEIWLKLGFWSKWPVPFCGIRQMPFISSNELFSRIKALYRETLHLSNPFQKTIQFISIQITSSSNTRSDILPAVINNIWCHPYKRASGPLVCGSFKAFPSYIQTQCCVYSTIWWNDRIVSLWQFVAQPNLVFLDPTD